jgi:hypothetical protein
MNITCMNHDMGVLYMLCCQKASQSSVDTVAMYLSLVLYYMEEGEGVQRCRK